MQQFDYSAWSLYTGPAYLQNIIDNKNCPWVLGKWNAINNDTSIEEIKKDLDERISLVLETFKQVLKTFSTYNRHFVIPEFFFRCKQGPYPNILVDGENYPFEYIVSKFQQQLEVIIPNDNNYYSVVIGSVLTSNVDNYPDFLSSNAVTMRLQQLNTILSDKIDLSTNKKKSTWNRHIISTTNQIVDELSTLNCFMKECRANPLCTVRNRGAFFHYNKSMMDKPEVFIYEKQNESTVDLTMGMLNEQNKLTHGGMITEWMANYPSYSIIKGDKHVDKFSTYARFTPKYLGFSDVGVEICLDHRLQRLRRTVDMSIENGADANNYPIFKQIIPSGGMQILDYSVTANRNCAIFNVDGCDKIYSKYGDENTVILNGNAGSFTGITCGVYNKSVQSKWVGKDGNTYYSHSQLAFTTNDSCVRGFDNALGINNIKAKTYQGDDQNPYNKLTDDFSPSVVVLDNDTELFASNTGELHIYKSK